MGNCLCCFPNRAKDELHGSYKVLADGPVDNSNMKDETITEQNVEQKTAPKEIESKEASSNEALKPGQAKGSEVEKSNQPIKNVPEHVTVEKPSEPKVGSDVVDTKEVGEQTSNNNGAVKEPKEVAKTEDCSQNKSVDAEKKKVVEEKDDVQDILDEAISINVEKNNTNENSDKPPKPEKDIVKEDVAQKSEAVRKENDNVRPVTQSVKLCNVSRAVVEDLKKEEVTNDTKTPEEKREEK